MLLRYVLVRISSYLNSLTMITEYGVHDSCNMALSKCMVCVSAPELNDRSNRLSVERVKNVSHRHGICTMRSSFLLFNDLVLQVNLNC